MHGWLRPTRFQIDQEEKEEKEEQKEKERIAQVVKAEVEAQKRSVLEKTGFAVSPPILTRTTFSPIAAPEQQLSPRLKSAALLFNARRALTVLLIRSRPLTPTPPPSPKRIVFRARGLTPDGGENSDDSDSEEEAAIVALLRPRELIKSTSQAMEEDGSSSETTSSSEEEEDVENEMAEEDLSDDEALWHGDERVRLTKAERQEMLWVERHQDAEDPDWSATLKRKQLHRRRRRHVAKWARTGMKAGGKKRRRVAVRGTSEDGRVAQEQERRQKVLLLEEVQNKEDPDHRTSNQRRQLRPRLTTTYSETDPSSEEDDPFEKSPDTSAGEAMARQAVWEELERDGARERERELQKARAVRVRAAGVRKTTAARAMKRGRPRGLVIVRKRKEKKVLSEKFVRDEDDE